MMEKNKDVSIKVSTTTEIVVPQELIFQLVADYINDWHGTNATPETLSLQYGNGDKLPKTIRLFHKEER